MDAKEAQGTTNGEGNQADPQFWYDSATVDLKRLRKCASGALAQDYGATISTALEILKGALGRAQADLATAKKRNGELEEDWQKLRDYNEEMAEATQEVIEKKDKELTTATQAIKEFVDVRIISSPEANPPGCFDLGPISKLKEKWQYLTTETKDGESA